jgi:4-amino-4-deoxy-L-arabinose transferase-like glycosyltransferase
VLALLFAAGAMLLYLDRLGAAPPYLYHDEMWFALIADSISRTGHDLVGRYLPVYASEPAFPAGRDPLVIYLTAAILKILPLSETSTRVASAAIGAANVGLVYLVARRLFDRVSVAVAAAAIIALTPAHFMHSRLGLSVIFPLPFVLGWLLALSRYLATGSRAALAAAGLCLGFGIYSYLAAVLLMPVYAAATMILLVRQRRTPHIAVFALCFLLPWMLAVSHHVRYPDRYETLISYYELYDTRRMNPLQGARDLVSYFSIGERANVYWNAFNPGRLFLTGDSNLTKSTRQVGAFLLPLLVLLPLGVRRLWQSRSPLATLILAGFITAPLPAVLVADGDIGRWLVIIPFAVLIAGAGFEALMSASTIGRMVAAVLAVAMLFQFAMFRSDYFSGYGVRSEAAFGGNIRDAVRIAMRGRPPVVYLSNGIASPEARWRFYTRADGHTEMTERAQYISLDGGVSQPAPGAVLIVAAAEHDRLARWIAAGWAITESVKNLDGETGFLILQPRS